jgi:hypothetical protein
VVQHNPITHAVEVRPQSSCSANDAYQSQQCDVRETKRPETDLGIATELHDPQDLIDEIFVGARRLSQRELPPDFQERLLAAIESDDIWADEPPLFLRDR